MDLHAFIASPAGLAIKGALVAAFLDFAFGLFAAVRDGSFALDAVAAFVRKHLAGRVFPLSLLASVAYVTNDTALITAAAAGLSLYAAETVGSIYSSVQEMAGSRNGTAPIPTD